MGSGSHWGGEGYACACLCTCVYVWMVRVCAVLSRVNVSDSFVSPWTVTPQTRVSLGVSRQECWSGLPFPPPGDLPDSGIEPMSPEPPVCRQILNQLSHQESPTSAWIIITINS